MLDDAKRYGCCELFLQRLVDVRYAKSVPLGFTNFQFSDRRPSFGEGRGEGGEVKAPSLSQKPRCFVLMVTPVP